MSFADALKKGLDANQRALASRKELEDVLVQASTELTAALGVPVRLYFTTSFREGLQTLLQQVTMTKPAQYTVDVLSISANGDQTSLADVRFSEIVYPVTINWIEREEYASNRDEFVAALEALLASRAAGEKISSLLEKRSMSPTAP